MDEAAASPESYITVKVPESRFVECSDTLDYSACSDSRLHVWDPSTANVRKAASGEESK